MSNVDAIQRERESGSTRSEEFWWVVARSSSADLLIQTLTSVV